VRIVHPSTQTRWIRYARQVTVRRLEDAVIACEVDLARSADASRSSSPAHVGAPPLPPSESSPAGDAGAADTGVADTEAADTGVADKETSRLFTKEVMPHLHDMWDDKWENKWWPESLRAKRQVSLAAL